MAMRPMSEAEFRHHCERVSSLLARHAELGGAPWMRSFDGRETQLPIGMRTGRRARDGAAVWLAAVAAERGWRDPRWLTHDTAHALGARVIRGQRATPVNVWKRVGAGGRLRTGPCCSTRCSAAACASGSRNRPLSRRNRSAAPARSCAIPAPRSRSLRTEGRATTRALTASSCPRKGVRRSAGLRPDGPARAGPLDRPPGPDGPADTAARL